MKLPMGYYKTMSQLFIYIKFVITAHDFNVFKVNPYPSYFVFRCSFANEASQTY